MLGPNDEKFEEGDGGKNEASLPWEGMTAVTRGGRRTMRLEGRGQGQGTSRRTPL